jgi:hypothetical protein
MRFQDIMAAVQTLLLLAGVTLLILHMWHEASPCVC